MISAVLSSGDKAGRDAKRSDLIGWGWGGHAGVGKWFGMTMPAGVQLSGQFHFADDLEEAIRVQS